MDDRWIVVNSINRKEFMYVECVNLNGTVAWTHNIRKAKACNDFLSAVDLARKASTVSRYMSISEFIFIELHPRSRYG